MVRLNDRRTRRTAVPVSMKVMEILISVFIVTCLLVFAIQVYIVNNHLAIDSSQLSPLFTNAKHASDEKSMTTSKYSGGNNFYDDDDADEDIKPILKILSRGGYNVSKANSEINRSMLPKWSKILDGYGPPRILGLESCQSYRDSINLKDRNIAPAGIFNTGTNVLASLIEKNCRFGDSKDPRKFPWQVPWGKHIPVVSRTNHTFKRSKLHYSTTLAVVTVRDPYTWMQSMCRQPYAANFEHGKSLCPNIVPYPEDIKVHPRFKKMKYIPVHVKYSSDYNVKYESLAHFWNQWYTDYIEFEKPNAYPNNSTASTLKPPRFPFLVVRMEDLVFHAEEILPEICECAGATLRNPGDVRMDSKIANQNHGIDVSEGSNSGLLRSVIRYGNFSNRRTGYPNFQLDAAKEVLDSRLMDALGYSYEDPTTF